MAMANNETARLEQWKRGFEQRMDELLKANPLPVPEPRDLTDIKLINAEDELVELNNKVSEYEKKNGNHKTNEYHAIELARYKLTERLDAIEVSGDEKYRKRRTDLYTKLDQLQKNLIEKIHLPTNPPNCTTCIHVKAVDVILDK